MQEAKIAQLKKKLIVRFSGALIDLPVEWQEKVDMYWQSLIDSGKTYTRGEVFSVVRIEEKRDAYEIFMKKTDYAHYLYCHNIDREMGGYGTRVVFTACLVETSDKKIVFGKMGEHTARAGLYQLAGGGIDDVDLKDGIFDLKQNISREIVEELGLDLNDHACIKNFSENFLIQGGKSQSTAIIYHLELNRTSEEFLGKYDSFIEELKQRNENPEFHSIVFLEKSKVKVDQFFEKNRENCAEYMEPLLVYMYGH